MRPGWRSRESAAGSCYARTTASAAVRAELQALTDGKVRLFCLTNAQLTFAEQAEWFLTNRHRIVQASREPGPYVYGIYRDRIAKLWPR